MSPSASNQFSSTWLRHFSKITCYSTLFLIFAGGMVKSTDSGLAVPDWPLSYGTWFPPMVGGVFYEHGHRMIASLVGLLTLILSIWLWIKEERKWIKILGISALLAVIIQGVLGGITVLYFLPTPISVSHGVLAQTFFLMTIMICYGLSNERFNRNSSIENYSSKFIKINMAFIILIYLQLIFGAIMRHTESGLAIYDFPKMAGYWIPPFNAEMLARINDWRFGQSMPFVTMEQVIYHFIHRLGGIFILIAAFALHFTGKRAYKENKKIIRTLVLIDILITMQIILGIGIIHTLREPITTSIHVVNAAAILGVSFFLLLRASPLKFSEFMKMLK